MQLKHLLTISFALLLSLQSFGQLSQEDYLEGKEFLKLGKYNLATQKLMPFTAPAAKTPFKWYASYYYALSAYEQGKLRQAKDMMLQITVNNPDWKQIDEAYLWLVKFYLETDDFSSALKQYQSIKDQKTSDLAGKLIKNDISEIQSLDSIQALYELHQENRIVGERYARLIFAQPLQQQDRKLLEELVIKFELDRSGFRIREEVKSIRKNKYQVAVILPFLFEDLSNNRKRITNRFILDLYQGIQLAVDHLKSEGVNIELLAYDTRKDSLTTKRILERDEMKFMDLIIGPLYPGPVNMVSRFSFQNKIVMVNPISQNPEVIQNNPYAFLMMPSYATMSKRAAEYVSQIVHNPNAFIFLGKTDRDSIMAYTYGKTLINNGLSVNHMDTVSDNNPRKILDVLTSTQTIEELENNESSSRRSNLRRGEDEFLVVAPDSIGHVFITSDEASIASMTITALETRMDSTILVGRGDWLEDKEVSLQALERLKAILMWPMYYDHGSEKVRNFRERYAEKYNTLPEKYSFLGYDEMMVLGRMLQKHGNHFENSFGPQHFIKGVIFEGYSFAESNDNQFVPLIQFSDAELILLNPQY
jgi:ABC-type branched-subunit amino acid transport system substrate-binding protein